VPKAILAVFSNPTSPETEDEFNSWYDTIHLKELLAIPGVVAAKRYRLADGPQPTPPEQRYLTLYELEAETGAVLAALGSRMTPPSPALDTGSARLMFWEPIEPEAG
jgi:hypothetical protein